MTRIYEGPAFLNTFMLFFALYFMDHTFSKIELNTYLNTCDSDGYTVNTLTKYNTYNFPIIILYKYCSRSSKKQFS